MRTIFLMLMAAALACAQNSTVVAGGWTPDGFQVWGRGGGTWGAEAAYTRVARETERTLWYVRREQIETPETGVSVRWRSGRLAIYGGAGVSREIAIGTFEFLYPEPLGQFGGADRHISPYLSGTATVRIFRMVHGAVRYTWRTNSNFTERDTVAAGLAIEF